MQMSVAFQRIAFLLQYGGGERGQSEFRQYGVRHHEGNLRHGMVDSTEQLLFTPVRVDIVFQRDKSARVFCLLVVSGILNACLQIIDGIQPAMQIDMHDFRRRQPLVGQIVKVDVAEVHGAVAGPERPVPLEEKIGQPDASRADRQAGKQSCGSKLAPLRTKVLVQEQIAAFQGISGYRGAIVVGNMKNVPAPGKFGGREKQPAQGAALAVRVQNAD